MRTPYFTDMVMTDHCMDKVMTDRVAMGEVRGGSSLGSNKHWRCIRAACVPGQSELAMV